MFWKNLTCVKSDFKVLAMQYNLLTLEEKC